MIAIGVLTAISIANFVRLQSNKDSVLEDFQSEMKNDSAFTEITQKVEARQEKKDEEIITVSSSYIEKNLEKFREALWEKTHVIASEYVKGEIVFEGQKDILSRGKFVLVPPGGDDPDEGKLTIRSVEAKIRGSQEMRKLFVNEIKEDQKVNLEIPAKAKITFDPEKTSTNYIIPCRANIEIERLASAPQFLRIKMRFSRGDIKAEKGAIFDAQGDEAKNVAFFLNHEEELSL